MQIRRMQEEDLDQVAAIEKSIFSLPWSRASFQDAYKKEENIYLVAVEGDKVLGYVGMWSVLGEGDITNVAVSEAARRRGVGEQLISTLLTLGRECGTDIFFLEVRESNQAARRLYEKLGFNQIGIRKNFYEKPVENGIVMSRTFF